MNKILIIVTIIIVIIAGAIFLYIKNGGEFINIEKIPQAKDVGQAYSLEEVSVHNLETDCWVIVNNKVYDMTTYIPFHPGGKAILNGCGKEVTVLFENKHSDGAKEKLNSYYVGDLK